MDMHNDIPTIIPIDIPTIIPTNTIDNNDLKELDTIFDSTNHTHSIISDVMIEHNEHNEHSKHILEDTTIIKSTMNIPDIIHDNMSYDNMSHTENVNDIANMDDFEDITMTTIKSTLTNSLHNFETQLSNTTNNHKNTNELKLLSNKLKQYDHLDLEIPKVTFKNTNLNEIKTFDHFKTSNTNTNTNTTNTTNTNSINSTRSASESSYTQHIKKPSNLYIAKTIKNIRSTKSQKQSSEIDEIDHVYNKLQDYVRYMTIDRKNYSMIICKAIEFIENYKDNKNNITYIKKDIATKALNRLIKLDLVLSDFDKTLFLTTISNLIDLLVNSSKYNLNEKEKEKEKDKHKDKDKSLNNQRDDIILARSGQISYSLVDKLTTIVIKKHYSLDKILVNIGTLTNILMILADKYIYLSGVEKKLIVLQSMEVFVNERLQYIIDLEEDKKQELVLSLESIPILIDVIITLQKGKYKINKKSEIHKDYNDDDDNDDNYNTTKKGCMSIFKKKIKHKKKNDYDF